MANIDYITHSNGDLLWVDAATRDGKGRNIYNVYLAKGDKNLALQNYIALNKQNGSLNYKALIATNNDTSIVLPKQTFSIYGYRCEITEDKEIKEFSSTDVDGNWKIYIRLAISGDIMQFYVMIVKPADQGNMNTFSWTTKSDIEYIDYYIGAVDIVSGVIKTVYLYYSQITTVIAGKGLTVTDGVMSVNEEDSKYPHTFIKGNSADYVERNNDFVLLDTNEITK